MPGREHIDVCRAQVLADAGSVEDVPPNPANVRNSRSPAPLVQAIRVGAGADEHQQDVPFRSQRAYAPPRLEQEVETLPPDLDSTMPYRNASRVRDAKLSARILPRAGPPHREIERIEDAGDSLGWCPVVFSNPSRFEGRSNDETCAAPDGQRPEMSLETAPVPTPALKGGEDRNAQQSPDCYCSIKPGRLVHLAQDSAASRAADFAVKDPHRGREIGRHIVCETPTPPREFRARAKHGFGAPAIRVIHVAAQPAVCGGRPQQNNLSTRGLVHRVDGALRAGREAENAASNPMKG